MMSGRASFQKYKKNVQCIRRIFPAVGLAFFCYFFRGIENRFSILLRYLYYSKVMGGCGDAAFFGSYIVIKNAGNIFIGHNCSIHAFTYIDGAGDVRIGNDVSIAHGSSIVSFEHTWEEMEVPIKYNPVLKKRVVIGNDVWIGSGVRILAGAVIGDRVVVAAGAVVKGELESGFVYGGIPAKKIKKL